MKKRAGRVWLLGRWKAMTPRERIKYATAHISSKAWLRKELDWLYKEAWLGLMSQCPQEDLLDYIKTSDLRLRRMKKALNRMAELNDLR